MQHFEGESVAVITTLVSITCDTPLCPWQVSEGRLSTILFQRDTKENVVRDVKNVTWYKTQVPPARAHSWICSEVSEVRKTARLIYNIFSV